MLITECLDFCAETNGAFPCKDNVELPTSVREIPHYLRLYWHWNQGYLTWIQILLKMTSRGQRERVVRRGCQTT